jgi:hypothetical protein
MNRLPSFYNSAHPHAVSAFARAIASPDRREKFLSLVRDQRPVVESPYKAPQNQTTNITTKTV